MKYTILQAEATISDESEFLEIVREIGTENKVYITFFDADYIAGAEHVESAFLHAIRAFCSGGNVSRTPDMEVLLYASGTRQCSCAVQAGLKTGVRNYYILIFDLFDFSECKEEPVKKDEKAGEGNSKSESFGISSPSEEKNEVFPDFFISKNTPVIQRCVPGDETFSEHFSGILVNLGIIPVEDINHNGGKRNFFERTKSGLILIEEERERRRRGEKILEESERARLKEFFEISEEEIQVAGTKKITDLVLERVALLEISK